MDTGKLSKSHTYGMTNKKGDWAYMGYEYGYYWFSRWYDIFSTPLTAGDVKNIVYKK